MATATQTSKILSAEQEAKLRQPIDEYVGKIQAQIDELRTDGTERAVNIQNELDNLKRDRIYTAQEKTERETKLKAELAAAKAVEEKNKGQINKLIADAEAYLKAHYDSDYYQAVVASCKQEKVQAQQKYHGSCRTAEKGTRDGTFQAEQSAGNQRSEKYCPQEPPVRRQNAVG